MFDTEEQERSRDLVIQPKKRKRRSLQAPDRASEELDSATRAWVWSSPSGGTFIQQDPILTSKDDYLILPTHSEIQVYSTKTSLLVRKFRVDHKMDITCCALSAAKPDLLYVSTFRNVVSVWDWTIGAKLGHFTVAASVHQVLPLRSREVQETVLVLHEDAERRRAMVEIALDLRTYKSVDTTTTVLKTDEELSSIKSYADGSIIVAAGGGNKLLVGQADSSSDGGLTPRYTWREMSVPGSILSFDGQNSQSKAARTKSARKVPFLDLVVGLDTGVIVQYDDLLFRLITNEKKRSQDDIFARKLHWHRTGVSTVKWSRDGNYIVSGGRETVLVIWQLDTNERQYLPHLSTPIMGLTVSATGSSYALRLGDNSVMILSTADLLPSANVSGLAGGRVSPFPQAMALHPTVANRLVAAVPMNACDATGRRTQSSNFLQTYDLDSNIQVSRQALTRNMTTASNVNPTGQPVREPTVTQLALSHDGRWLATVEEWQPNGPELETMYTDADTVQTRAAALETCLRIWTFNGQDNIWELVTRVDEPHRSGFSAVMAIAMSPTRAELATVGADATIKLWTPKARHRNGVAVHDRANEQLYTWSSSQTISCEYDAFAQGACPSTAALAYSDDGSAMAASWSWDKSTSSRRVHLVDPASGEICLSQSELATWGPARLAFAGRFLLTLSQKLTVFDTLTCETIATITLDRDYVSPQSWIPSHVAVNRYDGTVAISVSRSEKPRETKLLVLSVQSGQVAPVLEATEGGAIKGLFALTTCSGYLIVDDKNRHRTLRPQSSIEAASTSMTQLARDPDDHTATGLDSIFGLGHAAAFVSGTRADETDVSAPELGNTPTTGHPKSVSSTSGFGSLDSLFGIVSTAEAPNPADLFQRVVRAVAPP